MSEKLSVPPTVHMVALLEDPAIARSIAKSHKEIERVLIQTGLDVLNEGNVSTMGPILLGIKHIQDILSLFKAKGDVIIEKENKQNATIKR